MTCNKCESNDILELYVDKYESWYYCYNCKSCWGDYYPNIPLEEFIQELIDQGFPKDAEKIKKGLRASENGE